RHFAGSIAVGVAVAVTMWLLRLAKHPPLLLRTVPPLAAGLCAGLGVHATKERAVVENGQIVIRPMNYLALSYDHRIIDGREAVLSLVAMKEALEDPARLILDI
ncbi:MAG TPA: 2-oxo acid dehydrogenase subunit E2, partial [Usitatibacter sp.]|nr:2-oxo acid dehydrogenase subunit E2 [Usitatibacter sp.]